MFVEYLRNVTLYRVLWLGGRPGGGKTSLALWTALQLLRGGYCDKLATNLELTVGEVVQTCDDTSDVVKVRDVAIVYDESWGELGTGYDKNLRTWLALPRKLNQFILLPSVLPLTKHVQQLRVERIFNGYLYGLPVWFYRWKLGFEKKPYQGVFPWFNPSRVFPLYDHEAAPLASYKVYRFPGGI